MLYILESDFILLLSTSSECATPSRRAPVGLAVDPGLPGVSALEQSFGGQPVEGKKLISDGI